MRIIRLSTLSMLTLLISAGAAWPQLADTANQGYQTVEDRARVATNLENPDRVDDQQPERLVASLEITKGSTVADIGTGVGFMLPYLVEAVGPTGLVYAEDIFPDFLDKASLKINEHGWKNVKTIQGGEDDAKLPAASTDLAFILDAYHHFNYPAKLVSTIGESLRPDGRLVLVDFYRSREHPRMSPERLEGHIRLDRDDVIEEVKAVGFRLEKQFDHLPHQYVLIFRKAR